MLQHFIDHKQKYLGFFAVAALVAVASYTIFNARADTVPTFVEDIHPIAEGYIMLPSSAIVNGSGYPTTPKDVAFDQAGNLYILDINSKRVIKYTPEGVHTVVIPPIPFGTGGGQTRGIYSFTVDVSGNIYITDADHRVQKFDSSGNFLLTFGSPGSADGQFNVAEGVVTDASGNVYVTDWNNRRVQKFDSSGNFISKFGTFGSGDGQFLGQLFGITIDSFGNIYVVDDANYRVQKFDSSGNFLLKFGTQGTGNGQFTDPRGIEVDSTGAIYVTDATANRVQKFDSSGNYVSQFETLSNPYGLAVDASDNVYVTENGSIVSVVDNAGVLIIEYAKYGQRNTEFSWLTSVALDGSGNTYIMDAGWNKIWKYDSFNNFIASFGSGGSGDGQFSYPEGMAVDASGNIYLADSGNNRIQKLDSSGNFLLKFGSAGSGNGQFDYPNAIAIDTGGAIYVLDSDNYRIQKFNAAGEYVSQFGSAGADDGQFDYAEGVAVDFSGNIYVTDSGNDRIQKFDSSGNFLMKFGTSGTGNGQFDYPSTLALDSLGNIYVYDTGNNRVQKFDSSGNFVSQFGSQGIGNGSFWYVEGMAISPTSKMYFADPDRVSIWQGEAAATAPVITDVTATSTDSVATIAWTTDIIGSSFVEFGPSTSYGSTTPEADISSRVTSHTVEISNLVPCSRYNYRVKSTSATASTASSSNSTFTTLGCTGAASSTATVAEVASSTATSTVILSTITVSIPPDFATTTTATTTFQALKLDPTPFFASSSVPTGTRSVGTDVFHLKALTDATTTISTFTAPLSVTLSYSEESLSGINPETLTIYRYDGSSWHSLSACTRDISLRTVTCETQNFSDFALFGYPSSSSQSYGASGFVTPPSNELSSTPPAVSSTVVKPETPLIQQRETSTTSSIVIPSTQTGGGTTTKKTVTIIPKAATSVKSIATIRSKPISPKPAAVSASASKPIVAVIPQIVTTSEPKVPQVVAPVLSEKSFLMKLMKKVRCWVSECR